jgi:hypothetical protein
VGEFGDGHTRHQVLFFDDKTTISRRRKIMTLHAHIFQNDQFTVPLTHEFQTPFPDRLGMVEPCPAWLGG